MHGVDVVLYERAQTGKDDFGAPIWEEHPVTVGNVLIGQPSSDDVVSELQLSGKRISYVLAIPKGDTHRWEDCCVEFFGRKWRTFGGVVQGIDAMMPLAWNKQVKVELYE